MNQLINDIFGDSYITLDCKSGECMHVSEVPGFVVRTPLVTRDDARADDGDRFRRDREEGDWSRSVLEELRRSFSLRYFVSTPPRKTCRRG